MDIQNFGSVDVQSFSEDINYELISFLNVFWEHKHPQSVVERTTADSKTNMLLEENKKHVWSMNVLKGQALWTSLYCHGLSSFRSNSSCRTCILKRSPLLHGDMRIERLIIRFISALDRSSIFQSSKCIKMKMKVSTWLPMPLTIGLRSMLFNAMKIVV